MNERYNRRAIDIPVFIVQKWTTMFPNGVYSSFRDWMEFRFVIWPRSNAMY